MGRAANAAGLVCLPFVVVWLADGMWKARLAGMRPAFWAVDIAEWVVLPVVCLWLAHRFSPLSPRQYGLYWPGAARFAGLLFACTLSLFVANAFGYFWLGPLLFKSAGGNFDYLMAFPASGALQFAAVYYLSATAGLCESLFLLALPWLWFSQGEDVSRRGRIAFALTTALIFALGHWESGWWVMSGAFTFQLGAAAWYLGMRNLWPIVGAHFLIDLYWFWIKTLEL